ncbi:MAG: TRAP transporter small permease [Reyranellaceae bacterium]
MTDSQAVMHRMFSAALLWHGRIVSVLGHAAGWAFGLAAVLICADIAVRYFGLGALPWVIELTEYLMFGAAFLGAPWVLKHNGHVSLDILATKLPPRAARSVETVAWAFGLVASLAMFVYGASASFGAWQDNMVTVKTWSYDEWLLLLPIPVSGLLMTVDFAGRFVVPPPPGDNTAPAALP